VLGAQPFDLRRNMIPAGYRAYLLGTAGTLEELLGIGPLEESVPEGALMLMRLDFIEAPQASIIYQIEQELVSAGVPTWPGQARHVQDEGTSVYISWVKGIAWMPVIVGILLMVVLPTLLGGVIWLLLPESVKEMINVMVMLGVLVLMMKFMSGAVEEKKK